MSSNLDKIQDKEHFDIKRKFDKQTLVVVNSDFKGEVYNRTVSVKKGEVVVLMQSGAETDVDLEWFYVRKRDGNHGFIPAAVVGHGYI